MFTSYKPGVLRPELIRLRDVLTKGSSIVESQLVEVPKRKKGWFSRPVDDLPDPPTFNVMSMVADKRLLAMIKICDHAFDNGHVVYMNEDDLMYIDGLKGLEKLMKEMSL